MIDRVLVFWVGTSAAAVVVILCWRYWVAVGTVAALLTAVLLLTIALSAAVAIALEGRKVD